MKMTKDGAEHNEDSINLPPSVKLFLGVLPVDVNSTIEFLQSLRQEGRETTWDSLFRRAANFGISLGAICSIALGLFITIEGTDTSEIPIDMRIVYLGLFGLLFILAFSKWLIKQMQNINAARSPVAHGIEDRWGVLLELAMGLMLLAIPVVLVRGGVSPLTVLVISLVGGAFTGITIAGFALVLSSFSRIKQLFDKSGKNSTLDEYANE